MEPALEVGYLCKEEGGHLLAQIYVPGYNIELVFTRADTSFFTCCAENKRTRVYPKNHLNRGGGILGHMPRGTARNHRTNMRPLGLLDSGSAMPHSKMRGYIITFVRT